MNELCRHTKQPAGGRRANLTTLRRRSSSPKRRETRGPSYEGRILWTLAVVIVLAFAPPASALNEKLVLRMVNAYGLLPSGVRSATTTQVQALFKVIGVSVYWAPSDDLRIPERGQAELLVLIRGTRPEKIGFAKNVPHPQARTPPREAKAAPWRVSPPFVVLS